MNPIQILQVMRARWLWLVVGIIVTVGFAYAIASVTPPRYTSQASLVVDIPVNGLAGSGNNARVLGAEYLTTQAEVIRSRLVIDRVVNQLTEAHTTRLRQTFNIANASPAEVSEGLVGSIRKGLVVEPSRESRVITIGFESLDPEMSALIANTIAEQYMEVALELRVNPARQQADWFEDQLEPLRLELLEKQAQFSAYQERAGIITLDERLDGETRRLEQLSARFVQAQSRTADVRSRQLGSRHPEYQSAVQQERAVEALLEEQREKLFELKRERDQLSILQRELESTQANYDATMERYRAADLASQIGLGNVSMLTRAEASKTREHNFPLILIVAAILGAIIGFVAMIAAEFFDRRVYTEQDLKSNLNTDVVVSL